MSLKDFYFKLQEIDNDFDVVLNSNIGKYDDLNLSHVMRLEDSDEAINEIELDYFNNYVDLDVYSKKLKKRIIKLTDSYGGKFTLYDGYNEYEKYINVIKLFLDMKPDEEKRLYLVDLYERLTKFSSRFDIDVCKNLNGTIKSFLKGGMSQISTSIQTSVRNKIIYEAQQKLLSENVYILIRWQQDDLAIQNIMKVFKRQGDFCDIKILYGRFESVEHYDNFSSNSIDSGAVSTIKISSNMIALVFEEVDKLFRKRGE